MQSVGTFLRFSINVLKKNRFDKSNVRFVGGGCGVSPQRKSADITVNLKFRRNFKAINGELAVIRGLKC